MTLSGSLSWSWPCSTLSISSAIRWPDDRGVLELVAARADRHVEAVEVRAVVDRDPVVGDVVEVDDALALVGDPQRRDAAGEPVDLGLPLLLGDARS